MELCELNPKTQAEDHLLAGFTPMHMLGVRYRDVLGHEARPWGEIKKAYTHFQAGDVLLAKVTPCFENGKSGIASGLPNSIGAGSSEIYALRPANGIDSRYLLAYLSTDDFRRRATMAMTGAVGLRRVPREFLLNECVPIAPVAEQQRIADKLDTVLARVDAVNTRLARIAPLLKRFRQSVLAAATSGRLTEDWRITHEAEGWTSRTVESLCLHISDGPFGSHLKSDDYTDAGARVVRLENIGHLFFDASKETFVSLGKYESLKKHTLAKGDLLFSSFVDEEVRVCEFPSDIPEPTINKADCFCVRADEALVNRRFLAVRLACKSTYESLKDLVHGATRPRINLRQLRGLEVMLPSMSEQAEIVRRVDILFAIASRIELQVQTAQSSATRLTPALLAKAFRGELVPQDPADEPATELLRRLAESKASSNNTPRGRRARAA